jgi:hypothetical protein
LPDLNFDLGEPTKPAVYRLADSTYAELVDRLAKTNFAGLRQGTKASVTRYYTNMGLAFDTRRNEKAWSLLNAELQELKRAPAISEPQHTNRKL